MTLEETKERLKYKGEVFLNALSDKRQGEALNSLVDLMIDVQVDLRELKEDKVSRSEIKELIIEMREGFKRVDQRFEDMQKYTDKRFNSIQWMIGLGFTIIAIITTVYKFVQ